MQPTFSDRSSMLDAPTRWHSSYCAAAACCFLPPVVAFSAASLCFVRTRSRIAPAAERNGHARTTTHEMISHHDCRSSATSHSTACARPWRLLWGAPALLFTQATRVAYVPARVVRDSMPSSRARARPGRGTREGGTSGKR